MERLSNPRVGKPEDIQPGLEEKRERILASIENKIEGLNIERIEAFFAEQDLRVGEFRVISPDQIPLLREAAGDPSLFSSEEDGFSSNRWNIVFVVRDVEMERLNGVEFTEAVLVHELAHSSTEWKVSAECDSPTFGMKAGVLISIVEKTEVPVRSGFTHLRQPGTESETLQGSFLEEGFAQMIAGQYLKKFQTLEWKQKFVEKMGATVEQIAQMETAEAVVRTGDTTISMSPFLTILIPNGLWAVPSSIAAAGVMDLCKHVPGFENALKESRRNIRALPIISQMIDSIEPGLYSFLTKLQPDDTSFGIGTRRIQDLIAH